MRRCSGVAFRLSCIPAPGNHGISKIEQLYLSGLFIHHLPSSVDSLNCNLFSFVNNGHGRPIKHIFREPAVVSYTMQDFQGF